MIQEVRPTIIDTPLTLISQEVVAMSLLEFLLIMVSDMLIMG